MDWLGKKQKQKKEEGEHTVFQKKKNSPFQLKKQRSEEK